MLLYARVLGNYIPMKIHISETLWMRPKLLMDLSSSGYQCTLSANFKDQALWSVDLGSVFGIHHIIYYRTDIVPWGKYLKVYFFGCCCCWEDPSSGEFNIRKVKHCTVTSSGSIVETVCWKHVCFLNSNGISLWMLCNHEMMIVLWVLNH